MAHILVLLYLVGSSLPRGHHACAPLDGGKVLIAGGGTSRNFSRILMDSVEVCIAI